MDTARIVAEILKGYAMSPWGFHGVTHWARVLENGLKLAEQTGAVAWSPLSSMTPEYYGTYYDTKRYWVRVDSGNTPGLIGYSMRNPATGIAEATEKTRLMMGYKK